MEINAIDKMTLAQLAESVGKTQSTLRVFLKKKNLPFRANASCANDIYNSACLEFAAQYAYSRKRKTSPRKTQQPESVPEIAQPDKHCIESAQTENTPVENTPVGEINIDLLIRISVNVVGALMIVSGLYLLFGFIGVLVASIICLFIAQGAMVVLKAENYESSGRFMVLYCLIEIVAIWLHKQTLYNSFDHRFFVDLDLSLVSWVFSSIISATCIWSMSISRAVVVDKSFAQ